jgi:hypothetical protein
VSTAPARSRWTKLPAHVGRARTSTLILGVLFLGLGALYLNVKPPVDNPTTSRVSDQEPAGNTGPAAPTTSTPPTSEAPAPTSEVPTTTEELPTTTPNAPTGTPTPTAPTDTAVPTETLPTGPTSVPTTVGPPG